MRYAIPLLTNRISPRCTIAECLLLLDTEPDAPGRISHRSFVPLMDQSWREILDMLVAENVGTLVCGGISRESRGQLALRNIEVVENVAATAPAVVEAIIEGELRPGYGFEAPHREPPPTPTAPNDEADSESAAPDAVKVVSAPGPVDCLACADAVCRRGEPCPFLAARDLALPSPVEQHMLDAALDLACEPSERSLCRLSEVIYYGLEMNVKRMGVAFCWDLQEPTRILVDLLRRYFEVVPVGCKVFSGSQDDDPLVAPTSFLGSEADRPCNPIGQAQVLAEAHCDLNLALGLCVGADGIFARHSEAPVTTLFVKDRSLANNPIGAIYSDYYLQEAMRAATGSRV